MNGVARGHLTIGMVTGCEVAPFFAALASFHRAHPSIELELVEDNSDQLVASVRELSTGRQIGVTPESRGG